MFKSAQVFYFTGTGNTLALAKVAAQALEEQGVCVELTNIVGYAGGELPELVGVFFPTYSYGAPRIVNRFLRRMPKGNNRSAFVIANAAASAGPAAATVGRFLTTKGYHVRLATWVKMPSNYILGREAAPPERAAAIVKAGESKVRELCQSLHEQGALVAPTTATNPFYRAAYWFYLKSLKYAHKFYRTTDKCTSCGACVEMCPTGSIVLSNSGRPVWQKGCEHCLRCVNLCPQAAIEFTALTKGKRRYAYWKGKV